MLAGFTLAALLAAATTTALAQAPPVPSTPFDGDEALVRNWLIVGMFPNAEVSATDKAITRAGWDVDYLAAAGGEAQPDAALLRGALTDGATIRYAINGPDGRVDLAQVYDDAPGGTDFRLAYGIATITTTAPRNAQLWLGSDDCAKVYVNGELVYEEWLHGRGLTTGEEQLDITLAKGENTIVVKADNHSGPWGFHVRLVGEQRLAQIAAEGMAGPLEFTRFAIEGHPEDARALNAWLWRFWNQRVGNFRSMFFQDYMTPADVYVNAAIDRGTGDTIQDYMRETFLTVRQEPSGYVESQQHMSTAHDGGWPFPLWPQILGGWQGWTAGWHFQNSAQDAPHGTWVWTMGMIAAGQPWAGDQAAQAWRLENARSLGIIDNVFWRVKATGKDPVLATPEGTSFRADQAPFMHLRWRRTGQTPARVVPYLEWRRATDDGFSPERRALIWEDETYHSPSTGFTHSHIDVSRHPLWEGEIVEVRLHLAPSEGDVTFEIDSFFTAYDTRKAINSTSLVLASWDYFRWTGDISYLRQNISRLRLALLHDMKVMGAQEHGHIRNVLHGHDGIPGWFVNEAGEKVPNPGHGEGNNYWDLLPFGWDDAYHTARHYAAVVAMAEMEQAIRDNAGWGIDTGALALDPAELREHAANVKAVFNEKFWNDDAGRFFGAISKDGRAWDYGLTFHNLDAIHWGVVDDDKARVIMDWISGARIVEGDTSTGEDIYFWQFGPRASTLRNIEWYGQGWTAPESLEFGDQIQDGGAVLGFTYYDLWARLHVYGPDNAWHRLEEILAWDRGVQDEGGYRAYYASRGVTLQGGGTAGGIGVDFEFLESSLPPAIIPHGFMGIDPRADVVRIDPKLPSSVPSMTIRNLLLRNSVVDITASATEIRITLHEDPVAPLPIAPTGTWTMDGEQGPVFMLHRAGEYTFTRG